MKTKIQTSVMLIAVSLLGGQLMAQTIPQTELNLSLLSKLGTQGSTVGTAGPFRSPSGLTMEQA